MSKPSPPSPITPSRLHFATPTSEGLDDEDDRRYQSIFLEGVENVEGYEPGGLLPISLGDSLLEGRYRILQKLGYGGSSTVWLARDQSEESSKLVTLKALRADFSKPDPSQVPEVAIVKHLESLYPLSNHFQTILHYFYEQSPNGTHLVIIYPFAGPNIASLYSLPTNNHWEDKPIGSRRFRADLARKVARDTANAMNEMHSAGIVHGDLTSSNILVRIASNVLKWTDAEIATHFGEPETEAVRVWLVEDGAEAQSLAPPSDERHAPPVLYESIPISRISDASLLQESTFINDFGQSFFVASRPADYRPGTTLTYTSPELFFKNRVGFESDVWSLACFIYELRTGYPLFNLGWSVCDDDLAMRYAEVLGPLPDSWLEKLGDEGRNKWFYENGEFKTSEEQEDFMKVLSGLGAFPMGQKRSIQEKLRLAGDHRVVGNDEGPMCEKPNVPIEDDEVKLLEDLLGKMLKYQPEDRITMSDVIKHPWFTQSP